jgi:hypothetical protein
MMETFIPLPANYIRLEPFQVTKSGDSNRQDRRAYLGMIPTAWAENGLPISQVCVATAGARRKSSSYKS